MNYLLRTFAGHLLIIVLAAWFGARIAQAELLPGMRQAVEVLMVESSNLVSEFVAGGDVATTPPLAAPAPSDARAARLDDAYARFAARRFDAQIYGIAKKSPDLHAYLTDAHGRVVWASDPALVGADFAHWNDVARTLQGRYGARATRADPNDAASTVMYVAAPVRTGERIDGVLTLGLASASIDPYVAQARSATLRAGGLLVLSAIGLALLLSWWFGRDLRRLSDYARRASVGERVEPPRFVRGGELATLSQSLATMRAELEGRAHAEQFAQLLAHELKGPLSAVRGAAELLAESPPEADRARFLRNIHEQALHMQALVERVLSLAVLENRSRELTPGVHAARAIVDEVVAVHAERARARDVALDVRVDDGAHVRGERVLLQQALANLVDNALAFAPHGSTVEIACEHDGESALLVVRDRGPGIPDYAQARLFERFYSLPRPDTGARSTGLGLKFVREVATLHGGSVQVRNREGGGVQATLRIPQRGR